MDPETVNAVKKPEQINRNRDAGYYPEPVSQRETPGILDHTIV